MTRDRSNGLPTSVHLLLAHLPAWMLVLFRLTGIFFFAPVFGSRSVFPRVKIFLALGLSFCIYPILLTPGSDSARLIEPVIVSGLDLWSLIGTVAAELLIGVVIGFGASLPLIGVQIGGRVVDQQMGLGLAGVLNPEFNEQSGIVGQFYFMMGLAVFIILGGHRVMLAILVGSFSKIPLGGLIFDGGMMDLIMGLMATVFDLGLRVSAPLLCLVLLQTVAMGFIARTVPQMNILSIGFALRILMGSIILIGAIKIENSVFVDAVQGVMNHLNVYFAQPGGR